MLSQEDVLEAIKNEYFGMEHLKGRSYLPQRIRALERW